MLRKFLKIRRSPLCVCLLLIILFSTVIELHFGSPEKVVYQLSTVLSRPFHRNIKQDMEILEPQIEIFEVKNDMDKESLIDPIKTSQNMDNVGSLTVKLPLAENVNTVLKVPEVNTTEKKSVSKEAKRERAPKKYSTKVKVQKTIAVVASTKRIEVNTTTAIPFSRFMTDVHDNSQYDPYIKTVMDTTLGCQNASSYDAIMAVHSAPNNAVKRNMFRWLYSDYKKTAPYRIKVYFFVGQVKKSNIQSKLVSENDQFNDIIQGSFIDAYVNLTYKAIFSFKWLNERCRGLRLLLRLDDDVFTGVHQFFNVWKSLIKTDSNTIMCDAIANDRVRREGKWLVKKTLIPEDRYFFTHCLGYFVALTPDLVPKMESVARRTPFFWIDDIFMYGFVAKKVGAKFVNIYRRMPRWNEKNYVTCIQSQGRKCNYVTLITKPGKFIYLHSLLQNSTNTQKKSKG